MKLDKEQQQIIEDSLWVVNTILKKQGLQGDEDLKQSAILYMSQCLLRYNKDFEVKWTTYAYKNVDLYIRRVLKKETAINNRNEQLCEDYYSTEITPTNEMFIALMKSLPTQEKDIVKLMLNGYNHKEIMSILNLTRAKLSNRLNNIKKIAIKIKGELK